MRSLAAVGARQPRPAGATRPTASADVARRVAASPPTPPAERFSPTLRVLDLAVGGLVAPLARMGGRRPEGRVDRDLACVVDAVETIAEDVVAVHFRAADGGDLPAWLPGAHVDVVLPARLGGATRQYSLTGAADDPSAYRIAVRRIDPAVGGVGGSVAVHALRPGEEVVLRGPRQAFPLVPAEGYLFVAGGIGITPVLSMLRAVVADGTVPWRLVHAGRSRASMPFLDEVAALEEAAGPVADGVRRVHVLPEDELGVPRIDELLDLAPPAASVYACGPVPMLDALRAALPDPRVVGLHAERFSAPPVVGGRPFTVRLARRGELVDVGAEESALQAVLRRRPEQAYSCRQGFCGTCRVRVLAGDVDHRDRVLTAAEREGSMLLCVSRGDGEVVLDV